MTDRREDVIALLAAHRQRATYGALAGVLGRPAIGVMSGLPKTAINSWVVSASTGLPTGYGDGEIDPALGAGDAVISDSGALLDWLRERR